MKKKIAYFLVAAMTIKAVSKTMAVSTTTAPATMMVAPTTQSSGGGGGSPIPR